MGREGRIFMFGLGTFFLSVRLDSVEFQVILMVFTEGPVAPGEVDVFTQKTILRRN